jgi:glucose/arabinose dehydrogenase
VKVNHGLQLSLDGKTLFASDKEGVFSWPYESKGTKVTEGYSTIISGMNQTGHSSRTLLISKKSPGTLLVSRGSGPNIDPLARDVTTGVSQIRAFDISGTPKEVKYTDGKLIGWGLRNSVGLGENPADGGIWSNENASDNMYREEKDIHETSPGEEINYHGDLASKTELHGKNYGYPDCAAAWDLPVLPHNTKLKIGSQFTHNDTVASVNDEKCNNSKEYIPPRLTLPSHWAPIDIAFNSKGTVAYMTSHGSWYVFRFTAKTPKR